MILQRYHPYNLANGLIGDEPNRVPDRIETALRIAQRLTAPAEGGASRVPARA